MRWLTMEIRCKHFTIRYEAIRSAPWVLTWHDGLSHRREEWRTLKEAKARAARALARQLARRSDS